MRLELHRSGGIAAPIRNRPVVVHTDGLAEQERARIVVAVAAARAHGSEPPSRSPGGADLLRYRVRIEDPEGESGAGAHAEVLTFSDPVDAAAASLIDLIAEIGKEQTDG